MADDARLRALFLESLSDELRPTFEADETLEVRLPSMVETAEAALGTFKITTEDYIEHLASVVPKNGTPEAFAKLRAADLYDDIWVYGLPQICNPLDGLELTTGITQKMTYTGYLPRRPPFTYPCTRRRGGHRCRPAPGGAAG